MTIEIKKGFRYKYECVVCKNNYIEQRNLGEEQFVNKCPVCGGEFDIINTTEFTYEVEVVDDVPATE